MSLIRNERLKLLATGLSGAGVGCFTAGVITSIGAIVFDFPGVRGRWEIVGLVCVIWLLVGMNLHLAGQLVLGKLDDEQH